MLDLLAFGDQGWGDEILRGAAVTILLAVVAFAFGLVLGTLAAAAKLSRSSALRWGAEVYTTVFRGVPELLVIYLFAFGSAGAVMSVASVFGYTGYLELPPFMVGVLAVGIISGAYSTEVIRGAIQSVPQGQIEAAMSVGMNRRKVFFRITLPQMLRFALPGLGNVWQLTLKDTALVSVAALAELMRVSRVASDSTREPFLFYMTAAILYLVMTTGSQVLFQLAERRAARGVRTA
jgi:octopine/nopaline transport system permease protein